MPAVFLYSNNNIALAILLCCWQAIEGCHQSKMFLHGPDIRITHFTLGLRKHDLQILVGLLTGHCTPNRHLAIMLCKMTHCAQLVGMQRNTPSLLRKCYRF